MVQWYVCFYGNGPRRRWWHYVLKRDFWHCMAIGYSPELEVWMLYDWLYDRIDVMPLKTEQINGIIAGVSDIGAILKINKERDISPRPIFRLATCVTAVKHLVGFQGRSQTPYSLYKSLIKDGATPCFTET